MKNHEKANEVNGLAVPLGLYWMPELEPQVNVEKTAAAQRPMAKRQVLAKALTSKVAIAIEALKGNKTIHGLSSDYEAHPS